MQIRKHKMSKRFTVPVWARLALVLAADVLLIGTMGFLWVVMTLPRIPEDPEALGVQPGVKIYADSGELLYTFNRRMKGVTLEEVSPFFIQAVLATEDQAFYRHRGFSVRAILGAFYDNLRHMRKVRGGSTITQQIVKNLFLSREKTYIRKLKEVLLAVQLETMFERRYGEGYKRKLLELYMNGSFYGTNAYGVEDAAQTYFGKRAADLNLQEAAVLAGLPNAPSALSPFREGGEHTMQRMRHVLRRMRAAGFITQEEMDRAVKMPPAFASERRPRNRTPYFVETIKAKVVRQWGRSALSFGGLNIYTTLDLKMQKAAEQAVAEGLADLDGRLGFPDYREVSKAERADYVQGALICLDPKTGYVRAMVGGRDIFMSYYNRATTARRQPGSGFKPVVYLAAFTAGKVTPVSLFADEPRTYVVNRRRWSPKNFKDQYLGMTTAAWALIRSANATSVQVAQRVGPERVAAMGKRLGIRSPLGAYPSLALGTEEVTLLDMASAFGTVANYGIRVEPTFVRLVEDLEGRPVYRHRVRREPVLAAADAYVMIRLMQNVVDRGTGRAVRAAGFRRPAAGKTGTTNDNTDAWFTGFTPELVASVWVGFDRREGKRRLVEARTRRQITGGSGAAPIWAAFMKAVAADRAAKAFWTPAGVRDVVVDARTGVAVDADTLSEHLPIRIALPEGVWPNTPEEAAGFQGADSSVKRER